MNTLNHLTTGLIVGLVLGATVAGAVVCVVEVVRRMGQ